MYIIVVIFGGYWIIVTVIASWISKHNAEKYKSKVSVGVITSAL